VRERHILPRNVTNVTRHIFCHRKQWQMWRHSPKCETGSWEEIRVRSTLRVGLSPNGLPASRFRDKWQIWDGKTSECFSPSRIVTFLPVSKSFVPAGPKCEVFREGCDKKRHKLQKKICVRERHILPRNVTNVTRHIVCHRKQWQMWRHSPKSETGSWEEIRVRPTLSLPHTHENFCVWYTWIFENRSLKFREMGVGQCGRRL